MKTLIVGCPEKLREGLREIVCWSCDGAKGSGETCDWRYQGKFCDTVDETVDKIHAAYYNYQIKELKSLSPSDRR